MSKSALSLGIVFIVLVCCVPAAAFNVHQFDWMGVKPGDSYMTCLQKTGLGPSSPDMVLTGSGVFRFEREGIGPVFIHLRDNHVSLIRHYYLKDATKRMGGVASAVEKMNKAIKIQARQDQDSLTWYFRNDQRELRLWMNHADAIVIDFCKK